MGRGSGKHWIIEELLKIADEQGRSLESVAASAGKSRNSLYNWRVAATSNPTIQMVESVANALGYELELVLREGGPVDFDEKDEAA